MDNRIFNVNGRLDRDGRDFLRDTIALALRQESYEHPTRAWGYRIDPKLGFVLYRFQCDRATPFPCALTADSLLPLVLAYFESKPTYECVGWDADRDHDGHNGPGWRVYCEDWGHVGGDSAAFLAIKPAFMWYGK